LQSETRSAGRRVPACPGQALAPVCPTRWWGDTPSPPPGDQGRSARWREDACSPVAPRPTPADVPPTSSATPCAPR